MSLFTSAIACAWSGVSSYSKASSNSFCHGESLEKAKPGARLRRAQPVERRLDPFDPGVLLDEVEPLDRKEERLLLRVSDLHELSVLALHGNPLQPLEKPDPVIAVNDRVAELQVAQIGEEGLRRAPARDGDLPLLAEDLALGIEREAWLAQAKTGRDIRPDTDERSGTPLGRDVERVLEGETAEFLGSSGLPHGDEDFFARFERARQFRRRLRRTPGVRHDRLRGQPNQCALIGRETQPVENDGRPREALPDPRRGMEELFWREDVAVGIAVAGEPLREFLDLFPDRRRFDRHEQGSSRPRGVIEPPGRHRRHGRSEHRALDLGGEPSDPLGQEIPRLFRFLRGGERRQRNALEMFAGALRIGIEDPDRGDPISIQLDPYRKLPVGREDVEESAAHREVSRLDHEVGAAIADARQPRGQTGKRDFFPPGERHAKPQELFPRGKACEERPRRQDGRPDRFLADKRREKRKLVPPCLERGRNTLVRCERRRGRVEDSRQAARLQIADQPFGLFFVRDNDGERPAQVSSQRGEQESRKRSHAARHDKTALRAANPSDQVRVSGRVPHQISQQAHVPGPVIPSLSS